jgi:hypothetical protein
VTRVGLRGAGQAGQQRGGGHATDVFLLHVFLLVWVAWAQRTVTRAIS